MKITEIKVFPVNEERLKAYITIILEECFIVRDLKIIKGNTGLFVAMPSKKRKDGTYRDIAHPLNKETRTTMEGQILQAYLDFIKTAGNQPSSGSYDDQDDHHSSSGGESGGA